MRKLDVYRVGIATICTFLVLISIPPPQLFAQLGVRSFTVSRYGKLPNVDQKANPSIYTDWTVEYRYSSLLGGIRVAGYDARDLGDAYSRLSQRYAEYGWDWGTARLGNSYGIFGRGLIFRAFELPGFVHESRVFRTQHSVIRDVDGVNLKLEPGRFKMQFIAGKTPVNALDPPEMQVDGDFAGGQISVDLPAGINIGTAYLQYKT